jgi:hypothetical protein
MMTNDMIGITGVFALVLVLFVIRYFILNVGRAKSKRLITPTTPRASVEPKQRSDEDDAWLLWVSDSDQTDRSNQVRDELAGRRGRAKRKGSSSPR